MGACAHLGQYRNGKGEMLTHDLLSFCFLFLFCSNPHPWIGSFHIQDGHLLFTQIPPKMSSQTHPKLCLPGDFKSSRVQKDYSLKCVARVNVWLTFFFLTLETSLYVYKTLKYIYNSLWTEDNNSFLLMFYVIIKISLILLPSKCLNIIYTAIKLKLIKFIF